MTGEVNSGKEAFVFLPPRPFVERALGKLGVDSVGELSAHDKAHIALAFHFDQNDRDEIEWLPELGLDERLTSRIASLMVARSAQMRTMLEILVGYEGGLTDFDPALLED